MVNWSQFTEKIDFTTLRMDIHIKEKVIIAVALYKLQNTRKEYTFTSFVIKSFCSVFFFKLKHNNICIDKKITNDI